MAEAVAGAPPTSLPTEIRFGLARAIAFFLPAALLAGAFGSQYFGGLYPCEMCWWQRYAHIIALILAAPSIHFRADSRASRMLVLLSALAIAVSGAIGVYHTGVELKIFEGFTTCTRTGAMTLQDIVKAPLIRCDQVQWSFLGVSMAGWNAILSLGGAALIAFLNLRGRRR